MGIRFDCVQPQVNHTNVFVTQPSASPCAKNVPSLDLLRANPVGYIFSRIMAPGSTPEDLALAGRPRSAQTFFLKDPLHNLDIHCESLRGRDKVAGKRCIVLFHGNCCDATIALHAYGDLRSQGDLIAVNAPGYGRTSAPNSHRQIERQMAANVKAVVEHVTALYDPKDIVWLGFSLGSAQAAMAFREVPGSHILLESPFTSMRALVRHFLPSAAWCPPWMVGVTTGLAMTALPEGWRVLKRKRTPADDLNAKSNLTDGLDTESKLRSCSQTHIPAGSRLGIVFADEDEIMAPDMPLHLWEAYYGADAAEDEDVVHCLRGVGHNGSYGTRQERELAYMRHIRATRRSVAKLFAGDAARD